ncbi:hypothetical protein RUK17_001263 [Vibrio cholerae]|uniref:hypothetical protein n=1 Tax=Vibrio cholerae TaxID=666 RepID=UPI000BA979B5|nr:hypothetical protein [Vibrio cholerae]EJK2114584.1 hypothetical protein [Vibrio navarrensis]EJE4199237.1 hypothetical protein [Vibrio cholerae]EJL6321918.1 hypothetical protein [Vibrio cholerae]EKF9070620.1 hypothetical protein [Vibrio cholerae]EKF9801950.1 hypothetical protein [Vibrio cholerae]
MCEIFKERVERGIEITKSLKDKPWRISELEKDPQILSALIAYHADMNLNNYIGGHYESSVREALSCLLHSELNRRAGKSNLWLTVAGFAVSLAGFVIAAVQIWLAFASCSNT